MLKKDRRQLERELVAFGFTTKVTSKGHLLVLNDGRVISCFAGTPSDRRSWRNSIAPLRRAGFNL